MGVTSSSPAARRGSRVVPSDSEAEVAAATAPVHVKRRPASPPRDADEPCALLEPRREEAASSSGRPGEAEEGLAAELGPLLEQFWAAIAHTSVEGGRAVPAVALEQYTRFHLALFRALRSRWTDGEARQLAHADWLADSVLDGSGRRAVTGAHVRSSLVSLALWWADPAAEAEPAAPADRGDWCRHFLAALLPCIARYDAAAALFSIAPHEAVPVGCAVRAAAALRAGSASASPSSPPKPPPGSSAPSSSSELEAAAAAARVLLASLEQNEARAGDGRRLLSDRTHLRRHALANRLRGRLNAGDLDIL